MTFADFPTSSAAEAGPSSDQNLARRMKLIGNAAPMLTQGAGAKMALQFASSSMDDETMLHTVQTAASSALVDSYKDHLTSIADPTEQWQAWNGFDAGQKRLIQTAGYTPPPEPRKEVDTSIIGITRDIGLGLVKDVTSIPGVKQVLGGLGKGVSQTQHLYRAASLGFQEEGFLGMSASPEVAKRRQNVIGDFLNLWGRTGNGEKTFNISALDRIHAAIPEEDKFHFTEALAGGSSVSDYLTNDLGMDFNDPNFNNEVLKYSQYQSQEDVQGAVKDLRNNKISLGRDLAKAAHLSPGSLPHTLMSGGIDATFDVLTDPVLYGGKAIKIARLARSSVTAAQLGDIELLANRVDQLRNVPRFRVAAEQIAVRFQEGNPTALLDEIPQMRNGLNDFNNYLLEKGIDKTELTSEHVFNYFKSTAGQTALQEGKFAMPHFPGTILPSLSGPERLKATLAIGLKEDIESIRSVKLADLGLDTLSPEQLRQVLGVSGKTLSDIQTGFGDFLHSFVTKIPKESFIGPEMDHSIGDFRAMLDYSLPGKMRDDFVNQWIAEGSYDGRRAIYEAGTKAMFHYSGAMSTEAGEKLANRFLSYGSAFASDNVDRLGAKNAGIGELDMAGGWAVPDFKEMLKVTAQTTKFRKALDYTNEGLIDASMSKYWKPAVLLKAGFIPRAYGEEYLGFILREGPLAYGRAQLAITATKEGALLPMRPVSWIADSLLAHIPYVPGAQTAEVFARNMSVGVSNFTREWAERLAPDKYLNAARNLAENGGSEAAGRALGTAYGEVSQPVAQRIKAEMIGEKQADGSIKMIPIKHGETVLHGRGDAFYPHTVIREMRRMQSDRLFAPLIDAGRRRIDEETGRAILGQFDEAGLITHDAGVSYGSQLAKLRAQLPDEVLPSFEKRLRNTSFASFDSVHRELVEAGMDPEVARDFIYNIDNLNPRNRVAIFTRDGEIEKVHGIHRTDPNAAFDVEAGVPYVRSQVEEQALREHNDLLQALWSANPTDAHSYMEKLALRRLNSSDLEGVVNKAARGRQTLDGTPVAAPPARGSRRVYSLVMDQDPAPVTSAFEMVPQAPRPAVSRINPVVDAAEGWTPLQTQEISNLIPEYKAPPGTIAFKGEELPHDQMAWFTKDFQHAQDIQLKLQSKFKGQNVSIGYVDVPEDVFQAGKNAATSQTAAGIGPLAEMNKVNQVYVPKTWRQNYQVIGDDYQIIDGHAAVGVDRQAALRDWAQVLRERYQQVFESNGTGKLEDVMHKLQDGRISVKDLWEIKPEDLPEHALGPAMLKPERAGMLNAVTQRGFDLVGQGGSAMIRNQMFLHYYAQRLETATETALKLLAEKSSSTVIRDISAKLGTTPNELRVALKSLPDDIRLAANPYEAAIARDVVPPALREVQNPEDLKIFTEAWDALYEHSNPDLMKIAEKHWNANYRNSEYTFKDVQDSYLSLDNRFRASVAENGLPDQIPSALTGGHSLNTDEWTQIRDALDTNKHIWKTAHDIAMKGAINDTIPWVDDHRIRSQFQQHGRNLYPFWFAQENFIKRTMANVYRDPAALRKAEIMLQGLHTTGMVAQNQFGEDVFNIPGTGFMIRTLARGADFFGTYSLPIANPMTGQLKYSLPGLDSMDRIGPSFSPVVAIPLNAIAKKFPELQEGANALLGQRGQGKSIVDMLIPSYAATFYKGLTHDPAADEQMISSSIHMAQLLEANGLGPPENADPYKHDDWMKRLQNHTRLAFMLKGVVGFFSPASPSVDPPEAFSPEFHKLLQKMPLDEALGAFLTANPDAKPYTIFTTTVPSGAPLPASEEAGKVLEQHETFFHNNPDAGPWLLPQSNDDTGFSNKTYNLEIARGLRERKGLKDWYDDYYFASAATDYFDTKDDYEMRMAAAKGNAPMRQQLTDAYQGWKQGYLDSHKIFAQLLVSPEAGQRRQRILDGMDKALTDPEAPDVPHKQALTDLVDTYKDYLTRRQVYKRQTESDTSARDNLKDSFTAWVMTYTSRNPEVQAFYDRVIRPEMDK